MVPSPEAPVAVYQDIRSWAGLLVLDVLALAYLAASWWLDVGAGELDVMASCLLGTSLLFVLMGSRRIEVGPSGIRMYRRGVLRVQRPLDAFSQLQPGLPGLQAIVELMRLVQSPGEGTSAAGAEGATPDF